MTDDRDNDQQSAAAAANPGDAQQPARAMRGKTLYARIAALIGAIGLLMLMPAWIFWFSPPINWAPWFLLMLSGVPLLPPLAGLLGGRPYTYAWTAFISMIYFTHGVVEAWAAWADSTVRWLALTEVLLAVLLYLGGVMYARWRSQELKR